MKIKKFDEITPNKAASFEMIYNSARRMINRALAQVERDYKQAGITVPESVVYEFLHLSQKLEQMAARRKADQLANAQTFYKPPMKPLVVGVNILKLIPADWRKRVPWPVQYWICSPLFIRIEPHLNGGFTAWILVEIAHRTQGDDANQMMKRILPKAYQIAFTGTPLMKKIPKRLIGKVLSKSQPIDKFGCMIDSYTMSEAEADGAVLPLIYQGRFVEQSVNSFADKFYERVSSKMTERGKKDFERKCIRFIHKLQRFCFEDFPCILGFKRIQFEKRRKNAIISSSNFDYKRK